jgi:hypothetical protein
MIWFVKLKLWWWRRGMHEDCVANQLLIWQDQANNLRVPFGACTRCHPRMVKIRDYYHPTARTL